MKLNHDCIRDLLLYLEDNLSMNNYIIANNLSLNKYSSDDILYTADKLYEAGFLNCTRETEDEPIVVIHSISYQGHQFLDTIRDNSVWKDTKSKLSKLASYSIPIIQQVATAITKAKLGLP